MCIHLEKQANFVFCSVVNPKQEIVACLAWIEPQPSQAKTQARRDAQNARQAPLIHCDKLIPKTQKRHILTCHLVGRVTYSARERS